MRLASFDHEGQTLAGVVVDDQVHPFPSGTTVLSLVQQGLAAALDAGEKAQSTSAAIPLTAVRLAPPLLPPSIRDFITFEQHVEGALRSVVKDATIPAEWYDAPAFYFTNPHALIGATDDVQMPPDCRQLDFELEVAAVLGGDGRDVGVESAADLLFGYTIFNDWSARDLQRREMKVGLGPCKGKDFASTLGPWIVTADELSDRCGAEGRLDLAMSVEVNGVLVGSDKLSSMAWSFPELLAYAARGAWVRAGDVLGSGTCGNGCLAERWGRDADQTPASLQVGDVVRMTVEGLGAIENRVIQGSPAVHIPRARRNVPSERQQ